MLEDTTMRMPLGLRFSEGLDARSRSALTVDGPTVVSFSGGRTSAYLLRLLLDAHGGKLPADCHVVFANTGKEDEATLRFVRECCLRFGVQIAWIEYADEAPGWRLVNYRTASRNGEPFEALIRKRNYLPNPVARFCTVELKILRIADYMRSMGHDEFEVLIGIRADEPKRVASVRANPSGGTRGIERRMPLAELGVTRGDVAAYWRDSVFDLGLPNVNGSTAHGNCDLCFLKHSATVLSLIRENPQRAVWWAKMEGSITNAKIKDGDTFRADRPSYAQMLAYTQAQTDAFGHLAAEAEDGIECIGCTD
jgi:3'-phosphoadenosine 5'-phosphosulfate sulfotransferase (PAPS reductase)/FAD synthetase